MTDTYSETVSAETLSELREILDDEFPLLITTYVDDADQRMIRLRAAIEAGDAEQIKAESHALKGSSRNLGANPVGDLFAKMEVLGNSGQLDDVSNLLADIEASLLTTQNYLRSLI